jgi:hypothetical protein
MTNTLEKLPTAPAPTGNLSAFSSLEAFMGAKEMAKGLFNSTIVPKEYQGAENAGNCIIAIEMAQRLKSSPLAVMQNLYIIHGRPSWSAQYVIAAINTSGKFSPLRFKMAGEGADRTCTACAIDQSGELLEGGEVSIQMAKDEGWYGKTGSKWKTMPEQMLRYRAAAFFGRLYAPEIMMGMQTSEELNDVIEVVPTVEIVTNKETQTDNVRETLTHLANDGPERDQAGHGVDTQTGEVFDPIPGLD